VNIEVCERHQCLNSEGFLILISSSHVHNRYFCVTNTHDYFLMSIRYFPIVTDYFWVPTTGDPLLSFDYCGY